MQLRQILAVWSCLLCLAACTNQDAFQARYAAGQQALQKKDSTLALTQFEAAAKLAEMELAATSATDSERRATLQTRLADAKSAIAKIKLDSSDLVGARQTMLDVLKLREQVHGHQHESVATVLSALATTAYEQQKYAQAEGYAHEAYEIRLKELGDKHPHVAIAANNLAEVYQQQGKDAEAEKMFAKSIQIYEQSDNQPGVLDVLNNLAMFYKKLGRLTEARKIIETALALEQQEGNTSAIDRAMTLNALGAIDKAMYEYESADKHYKDAIDLLDRNAKDPGATAALCDALDNYGEFLAMQSDYQKAEPYFKRAITMCEQSRGKNHASTAERLTDLGILYKNTGRLAEAEANLKRALEIQQLGFEMDSPTVLQTLYKLSAVYQEEKKYDQASALFEQLLPKLERHYGKSHPYVADVLENWSGVIAGDPVHARQAKELLARAKKIRGSDINVTQRGGKGGATRTNTPLVPKEVES